MIFKQIFVWVKFEPGEELKAYVINIDLKAAAETDDIDMFVAKSTVRHSNLRNAIVVYNKYTKEDAVEDLLKCN